MAKNSMQSIEWIRNQLEEHGEDMVREMLRLMVQTLMSAESDAVCGAGFGERNPNRHQPPQRLPGAEVGDPSGSPSSSQSRGCGRARTSRSGSWSRGAARKGRCFPSSPRHTSLGVSTRRVERLMETLGLSGISKSRVSEIAGELDEAVEAFRQRPLESAYPYLWLDALEVKSREGGRTVNVTVVVATGVNETGYREVLGVDVFTSEDGAAWLGFLRSLVARGLHGVKLTISDAHPGLKAAIAAVLPGGAWQRCRAHFVQNLLAQVPKSAHLAVSSLFRSIYAQLDAESVRAQYDTVLKTLEERFPKAGDLLARGPRGAPRLHVLPQGALASDLVQQPPGAPQQGDPAPHRRRRRLPQPRRHHPPRRRPPGRAARRVGHRPPLLFPRVPDRADLPTVQPHSARPTQGGPSPGCCRMKP